MCTKPNDNDPMILSMKVTKQENSGTNNHEQFGQRAPALWEKGHH